MEPYVYKNSRHAAVLRETCGVKSRARGCREGDGEAIWDGVFLLHRRTRVFLGRVVQVESPNELPKDLQARSRCCLSEQAHTSAGYLTANPIKGWRDLQMSEVKLIKSGALKKEEDDFLDSLAGIPHRIWCP